MCNDYFAKEKPLAHITGQTTFCGLNFKVSKKVLAPRDLTQQMVKDFIAKHKKDIQGSVLDMCCGCGCIGISIKKYLPQMNVTCVDKY
ncbi:MAG: methyltransferase [Mycoplasmoidaceae bacterium]|nr:methyltransferase [Mycoplasmoidaceae bacterium]